MRMAAPAIAPVRVGTEGPVVLALFALRWAAGIMENAGIPAMSQVAAVAMLGALGLLFLHRMRFAADAGLFVAGALAWIASGSLSYIANPGDNATLTISLLTLLVLYALFTNAATTYLRDAHGLRGIGRVLGGFVLVGAALSVVQVASGHGFVEAGKSTIQRAFGSDVHPVSFAIQIVAAMVALEIIRLKQGRAVDLGHIALIGAGAVALYLTYARTAWVMALLTLAYALLARGSWAQRLLLGVGGGLGAVAVLASSERFADLASLPGFLANFTSEDMVFDWRFIDNSVSWRIVNWAYGLRQALEQPVLGYGPGQSATSSYFSLEMHNIFLEAFFEGGLFGLGALLLTLSGLVRLHRRLPRADIADQRARALANGFGLSLLLAVTFSTSFVDQLMSFLIYILMITAAATPATHGSTAYMDPYRAR
jgi:O-antigen ligase